MIIRCRVPFRINFSGDGTDVLPYKDKHGGVALTATLLKHTYCSLRLRTDMIYNMESFIFDPLARYNQNEAVLGVKAIDLMTAVMKNNAMNKGCKRGFDFFIHNDAPPGSGLGSLSAMVVALIGLLNHFHGATLTNYDIARLAYEIEHEDLGIQGGMQDQYATTFGGFNFIEFGCGSGLSNVVVNPLRVSPDVVSELEHRLLLCNTGSAYASHVISTQIEAFEQGDTFVLQAMGEQKRIATEMKNALLQKRLDDFGRLLHEAWECKKKMAAHITSKRIDTLYTTARQHGALGGKLLGAGGGGYLLLYCAFEKRHKVARELEKLGGQVIGVTFDLFGLQTWEVQG